MRSTKKAPDNKKDVVWRRTKAQFKFVELHCACSRRRVIVEFTALAAAPASEGNNAPSSKDSCSESSTSPDSILTPKLLLKESYPDMWKIKQELIIDKIEDLKLKVQDGGQRIPIDRRTDGRVREVDSLKGQIRYAFRKQLRKKRSLRLDESYSECSMVQI